MVKLIAHRSRYISMGFKILGSNIFMQVIDLRASRIFTSKLLSSISGYSVSFFNLDY